MVKINTYRISLTNRIGEKQILNHFNGEDDFLSVALNYCSYIFQNRRDYADNSGNLRTFTLGSIPTFVQGDRYIHGYFDSAYTGEIVDIKGRDNDLRYSVTPDELLSRKFFFLIHVPVNSKYAYLIVQRKANHGVKSILETSLSQYLRFLGLLDYKIQIEDAPSYYLLETMLEQGRLKEVKLIKNSLMSSFQEHFANAGVVNIGFTDEVLKFSNTAITIPFKAVLFNLYRQNYAEHQQIYLEEKYFDEVSFTMELNDLQKTFYVKNKSKIRSNIDITNLVVIEDGEPTTQSMIERSLDIIDRLRHRDDDREELDVA